VAEQRRARRWGIFFKLLFFGYLVGLAGAGVAGQSRPPTATTASAKPHTALVRMWTG
jgi:protease-4